jgi:uncharacterized membrane protein YjgN (DUF898 family)
MMRRGKQSVSQLAVSHASAAEEPAALPFAFHGDASEYFQIWIVNLCLTVATLGLYAPWAKVRTRRYFAANLRVGGSAFDYDADPKRILVGRLIVLAGFGIYALVDYFSQTFGLVLAIVAMIAFPAAAVRSTAFHHRHTSFRGIRFRFASPYGEAASVLLGLPILAALTLGLALPWWYARRHAFVVNHSAYGTSGFGFDGSVKLYYRLFAKASLPVAAGLLISVVGFVAIDSMPDRTSAAIALVGCGLPLLAGLLLAVAIGQAGLTNLLYGNTGVRDLRFRSELRARPLAWLYVTNAVAVILTLGLATPWASVRLARLRAGALSLLAPSGLDAFAQASEPAAGLGEMASEAADLFDFDLGL